LRDVSGKTAEGDYHFMCDPPIIIEIKTYNRSVPTKEIDKLKRDMRVNNMSGILLSTTSGITGYKELSWECINNNLLVIVPNTGLNINAGIYSIMFMMALQKLYSDNNRATINYNIENILDSINDDLLKLESSYVNIENVRKSLQELKISHNQSIESIHNTLYDCELDITQIIKKIRYNFENDLNINTNTTSCDNTEIERSISELNCNPNITEKYYELLELINSLNFEMSFDTELNIIKNGNVIAKTKRYVRKVEFIYFIEIGQSINYVYGIERADKNKIVIEINTDNLSYIKKRLL
jgi:hypothetical protein